MITKRPSCSRSSFTDEEFDSQEHSSSVMKQLSSSRKKKAYRKWTKDEDDRLRESMNSRENFKDWSSVSKYVSNGRTDAQCQHRWERFLDPSITKGPWTDEEDRRVIELVQDYGARHWSVIAKELKGRVGKQCRERWHNHLNPLINKNPWTNDENLRLFILHQHLGNKWAEIAKYFNGRSDNSIKNHWNSSMKKKFHSEMENLKKQGLSWTALIPSDFSWPKFDQPSASSSSSRMPLTTITNRTSPTCSSTIRQNYSPILEIENHIPILNSNQHALNITPSIYLDSSQSISSDILPNHSAEDLEHLFFYTPSSPFKQLPMLSSCANYPTSTQNSQSDDPFFFFHSQSTHLPSKSLFASSSSPHLSLLSTETNLLSNDDSFLIKYQENIIVSPTNISHTSSPSKYRILNTPERPHLLRLSPSPKRDCFNEYLPFPEPILSEYYSSIHSSNKYYLSKTLPDKLGYNPTYTEILLGQTRDQRYITDQASRYLSYSSFV